jgi:hypothetical protein
MGRFQNNPSIEWVHPKSTHMHPLAWGNNQNWGSATYAQSVLGIVLYDCVYGLVMLLRKLNIIDITCEDFIRKHF